MKRPEPQDQPERRPKHEAAEKTDEEPQMHTGAGAPGQRREEKEPEE